MIVILFSLFYIVTCVIAHKLSLSAHADGEGVDVSVTVCLFFCVYTVTDFSAEDKTSIVLFCMVVRRRPKQGISHFGELCFPRSPKSG